MKQKTKSAAALAAACLLAVSLAGCGIIRRPGSTQDAPAATEPTAASDAFGQESVWMVYDDDQIGKDVAVERILAFDGNGNVTAYQCDGATFADLNGLSDEEIIDFAKQQDKAVFDAAKQSAIDRTSETLQGWRDAYSTLDEERSAGTYDTLLEGASPEDLGDDLVYIASTYDTALSNLQGMIATAEEGQEANEATEYQEPQPKPYTLKVTTDSSGNSAASEELTFGYRFLNFYVPTDEFGLDDLDIMNLGQEPYETAGAEQILTDSEETVELSSPIYSTTSIVYDTTFGGYQGLATVVEDATTEFTWDTVDAEGIEVD